MSNGDSSAKYLLLIVVAFLSIGWQRPSDHDRYMRCKIISIHHKPGMPYYSRYHYRLLKHPAYRDYIDQNPLRTTWQLGDTVLVAIDSDILRKLRAILKEKP